MLRESRAERHNLILRMLPKAAYGELEAQLELVTLPMGTVLYDVGEPIEHVYFPRTALVSLVGLTEEGQGTEMSMIGPEGFVGLPIVLGLATQQYEATIQMAGTLWKLPKEAVDGTNGHCLPLTTILHRYTGVRLTQLAQSAICNRFHTLKERLCRWLSTAADRMQTEHLTLTQEFLAQMIGARRPALASTLGGLQRKRLIAGERGRIMILNRPALEAAACACYGLVKREIEAFLRSPDVGHLPQSHRGTA